LPDVNGENNDEQENLTPIPVNEKADSYCSAGFGGHRRNDRPTNPQFGDAHFGDRGLFAGNTPAQ
jgi:hypothetical protein